MYRYALILLLGVLPFASACSGDSDDDDSSQNTTPSASPTPPDVTKTPAGDDDATSGDDDTTSGDDDATSGDDDASNGDDDATSGDDDATSGDDDASSGDDDASSGDDDATTASDGDSDGFTTAQGDCDDADAAVYPGALEVCDSKDNDCNGNTDGADAQGATRWYDDVDDDTYGDENDTGALACSAPDGAVADHTDCNDTDPAYHPGAVESCSDANDLNCDGSVAYVDLDNDTFAACVDCNDSDAGVNPDALEACNGYDDNCDGKADDADPEVSVGLQTFYRDADTDTYGNSQDSIPHCQAEAPYTAAAGGDCNDNSAAVNPAAQELCNGIDDDCDALADDMDPSVTGQATYYQDLDKDTFGDSAQSKKSCQATSPYTATIGTDCNDADAQTYPGAIEQCDGKDNNCNTQIDDGVKNVTWYADADGDGYGDPLVNQQACSKPTGYVQNGTDCDDTKPAVNPGVTETCNGVDDDCSGQIDDGPAQSSWSRDADGDGFGDPDDTVNACPAPRGYVADDSDCVDTSPHVYPGAAEVCNGIDDDCNGKTDDVSSPFYDDFSSSDPEYGLTDDDRDLLPVACPAYASLLLSEVSVTTDQQEYIEIFNPTAVTVDLTRYYLTDLSNTSSSKPDNQFIKLVNGNATSQINDFLVKFPDGDLIGPGEFRVIAIHKSDSAGNPTTIDPAIHPDYEIADNGTLPDMLPAGGTTIDKKNVGLSNAAEFVLLFYWDGSSSLVQDVDYFRWQTSASVVGIDRTNVTITGPAGAATYKNDTAFTTQSAQVVSQPSGLSYCRTDLTEGTELQTGGNGLGGPDETSENLATTWTICAAFTPGYL